jgi:anti-sigma factor RsiW
MIFPMPDKRLRDDLQATLEARRDLGPEYETALIDSFVERLDATIAARVRAELDHQDPVRAGRRNQSSPMVPIVLGSLGIGVPLTAIAASAGGAGLLVAWLSIVLINVAAAATMRRP